MYSVYFFTVLSGDFECGLIVAASDTLENARDLVHQEHELMGLRLKGREIEEMSSEVEGVFDAKWNAGIYAM